MTTARMSGFALLSFCLALITIPLNAVGRFIHFPLGLLGCIPAVICGHLALKQIRSQSNMGGRGFAITGLIIGYLMIVLGIISLVLVMARGRSLSRASMYVNRTNFYAEAAPPATDPNTAEIPATVVTGTVENLPFTFKTAEISDGVLTLRDTRQSHVEVVIALNTRESESLSGMSRIVPGQRIPPAIFLYWREGGIVKSTGTARAYVMRLQLGEQNGNAISGKIYLEMPETYGTKLAGTFEASVK